MTIPFLKEQRQTIDFGIKHPYSIYALDMGLGKSLCAIATAMETKSKALIICPSYGMIKLKKEVHKWYPEAVVSLLINDKAFYSLWDTDVAIVSYHYLPKADILFEWADIVIFDEAQYLKNPDAKRTDAAHKLIFENSIKRCLLLTGTPIENRVHELWSLLAICNYDPRITKSKFIDRFENYVDFANHFSYLHEYTTEIFSKKKKKMVNIQVQQWKGHKNIDELKEYMRAHYIRFKIDDVLDLPPSIDIPVYLSERDNPELLKAFHAFMKSGKEGVGADIKRDAATATATFTASYAQDLLDQDLQVIVFTDHPEAAQIIADKLDCPYIDGSVKMDKRQEMAEEFQSGKRREIVATTGSFSTSIDLFNGQDTIINDLPWKPSWEDQLRGRTRRLGQKGVCRYHYIYGTPQSEKIREALEEKRETIRAVI